MKINCIAIDDEPLALKKISGFIARVEYLNLLRTFDDALEVAGFLKTNPVGLIFLDIRMKHLSGLKFLESVEHRPPVIISSAWDEFAVKGYELNVAGYLVKPFSFEKFLKTVEKVYTQVHTRKNETGHEFIFVKTEYRIEKVDLKDILYIRGMKDYLQIVTTNRNIMTLQTFRTIQQVLPDCSFQRVHNSYIVALEHIDHIERNRIKIAGELIPVSESYRDQFFDMLRKSRLLI